MAFWFMENHTDNVVMSIKVKEQVYSEQSEYQR
ncbi:MAG: spermidine synthase, partial [Clostridiales bacterium]|nr:spermidine synthase [Clostridiales bacterium]